jgi:hypothetical protein
MRNLLLAIVLTIFCSPALKGAAQAPTATSPAPAGAASAAQPSAAVTPSSLLQRSLEELHTTLSGLRMEKWKNGTVRSEATANVASLQKDLQDPLPGLLAAADAAPQSISKALAVSRNLDALYDVLLRVVDGARVAAPGDQVDQLVQAMASVEKGRLALNDQLQQLATGQEKQVIDLRATIVKTQAQVQAAPVCPKLPETPPAPAAKRKVVKKKPATNPPATQSQPPTPAKPNPQ